MLAVSGAFPLTSDQPPLAVVLPKTLAALMPGWDRIGTTRATAGASGPQVSGIENTLAEGPSQPWIVPPQRNPFAIAGPPPSFEANVLEIERRFDAILAKIELARAQREMRLGSGGHEAEPSSPDVGAQLSDQAGERDVKGKQADWDESAEVILLRDWKDFSPKTQSKDFRADEGALDLKSALPSSDQPSGLSVPA